MAGEIPSFFDHIPITQNTINAIKLQKILKEMLKTPAYETFYGYHINQEGDKHLWNCIEHIVKESEKE